MAPPRRALARRRCRGSAPPRRRRAPRTLGTSVLTPTLRYEPAVIAQAFATLGCLAPGRVFLGVGTGEAMNETPVTGGAFPGPQGAPAAAGGGDQADPAAVDRGARRLRRRVLQDRARDGLRPARTSRCRSTSPPPARSPPSSPAASATASSARAARTRRSTRSCWPTSPRAPRQAGRDPGAMRRMIEIKVSYDRDRERAFTNTHWWAALALTPEQKEGVEDPVEMERLADANLDRAHDALHLLRRPGRGRRGDRPLRRARLRRARPARPGRRPGALHRAVLRRRAAEAALARARSAGANTRARPAAAQTASTATADALATQSPSITSSQPRDLDDLKRLGAA